MGFTLDGSFYYEVGTQRSVLGWAFHTRLGSRKAGVLYVIDARTGAVSGIVVDEQGMHWAPPAWSPDGKLIFYLRQGETDFARAIVAHDLETGLKAELYQCQVAGLALSPDGQRLAFVERVSKGSFSLKIMPASGGEPREILDQWKGRWLRWTPDGRHLLFARRKGRDQPIELWRIAVEGVEGASPKRCWNWTRRVCGSSTFRSIQTGNGSPSARGAAVQRCG